MTPPSLSSVPTFTDLRTRIEEVKRKLDTINMWQLERIERIVHGSLHIDTPHPEVYINEEQTSYARESADRVQAAIDASHFRHWNPVME